MTRQELTHAARLSPATVPALVRLTRFIDAASLPMPTDVSVAGNVAMITLGSVADLETDPVPYVDYLPDMRGWYSNSVFTIVVTDPGTNRHRHVGERLERIWTELRLVTQ